MSGREPVVHVRKSTLEGMLLALDDGRLEDLRGELARLLDFERRRQLSTARSVVIGKIADARKRGDFDAVRQLRELDSMLRDSFGEVRG